jgi:hypothetical protein
VLATKGKFNFFFLSQSLPFIVYNDFLKFFFAVLGHRLKFIICHLRRRKLANVVVDDGKIASCMFERAENNGINFWRLFKVVFEVTRIAVDKVYYQGSSVRDKIVFSFTNYFSAVEDL